MAVERTYRCNLCRDSLSSDPFATPSARPIGLYWQSWPQGWVEKPPYETENHICVRCLSSLQALPARCGEGYECDGGPRCNSDHK